MSNHEDNQKAVCIGIIVVELSRGDGKPHEWYIILCLRISSLRAAYKDICNHFVELYSNSPLRQIGIATYLELDQTTVAGVGGS